MPRKNKYIDVYIDRRLEPLLEKCLKNPEIKRQLVTHNLKENISGVAKLAIHLFLENINKNLVGDKHERSKAT